MCELSFSLRSTLSALTIVVLSLTVIRDADAKSCKIDKHLCKAVKVVIAGGPAVLITQQVIGELAKPVGIDPKAARDAIGLITRPDAQFELGKREATHIKGSAVSYAKLHVDLVNALSKGDMRQMGLTLIAIGTAPTNFALDSPVVAHVARLGANIIPATCKDTLMEPPKVIPVQPQTPVKNQAIVYYINGMLTDPDTAKRGAQELANHLGRPVGLIYNTTTSDFDDGAQAVYDKAWPLLLANASMCGPIGGVMNPIKVGLNKVIPGIALGQANRTTRQVTHLLHHSKGDIAIVSHSQGCLIVRNALLTANRLGGGFNSKQSVRWVAAGTPLMDSELLVDLKKYKAKNNPDDVVAQVIGTRLIKSADLKSKSVSHNFINSYARQIPAEYLQ
jgi:hypothetical protein